MAVWNKLVSPTIARFSMQKQARATCVTSVIVFLVQVYGEPRPLTMVGTATSHKPKVGALPILLGNSVYVRQYTPITMTYISW